MSVGERWKLRCAKDSRMVRPSALQRRRHRAQKVRNDARNPLRNAFQILFNSRADTERPLPSVGGVLSERYAESDIYDHQVELRVRACAHVGAQHSIRLPVLLPRQLLETARVLPRLDRSISGRANFTTGTPVQFDASSRYLIF